MLILSPRSNERGEVLRPVTITNAVTSRAKARVGWEIRKREESFLIKSEW